MYEEEYLRRVNLHLEKREVYEIVENHHAFISDLIAKITSWTEKYKDERGMTSKITDWVIPSHDN